MLRRLKLLNDRQQLNEFKDEAAIRDYFARLRFHREPERQILML
jgi:hypothetical protein